MLALVRTAWSGGGAADAGAALAPPSVLDAAGAAGCAAEAAREAVATPLREETSMLALSGLMLDATVLTAVTAASADV